MFKRLDFELNANTNCYGDRQACVLDMLAQHERDAPFERTRIANDVHERLLLAHAIVIRGGVKAGPGTLMFVQQGLSSRSLIHFGIHAARRSRAIRVPIVHAQAAAVMSEWTERELSVCDDVHVAVPEGYYCVDIATRQCTCFDFVYHGQARGGCKHIMACVLTLRALDIETADIETAACRSLRDFTTSVREREQSVRKGEQMTEVLSYDAMSVWEFCCTPRSTPAGTDILASLETQELTSLMEEDNAKLKASDGPPPLPRSQVFCLP
jgi:hypothetical protein